MGPHVISFSRCEDDTFGKPNRPSIRLKKILEVKVESDAHCGATVIHRTKVASDPAQPNFRQVHLTFIQNYWLSLIIKVFQLVLMSLEKTYLPRTLIYYNCPGITFWKLEKMPSCRLSDFATSVIKSKNFRKVS